MWFVQPLASLLRFSKSYKLVAAAVVMIAALLMQGTTTVIADILPNNILRNPDMETLRPESVGDVFGLRPVGWHFSFDTTWDETMSISATHSLGMFDEAGSPGFGEFTAKEWRAYGTTVPAGVGRTLFVRWFWNAEFGSELIDDAFRANIRTSTAPEQVDEDDTPDLVGDITDHNVLLMNPVIGLIPTALDVVADSGASDNLMATALDMGGGWIRVDAQLDLPDDVQSMDIIFLTEGLNVNNKATLGTMFVDDASASIDLIASVPGDADGDGDVDLDDFNILASNMYTNVGGGNSDGDFDQDGDVDFDDFIIQAQNMPFGGPDESIASLPEPASLLTLAGLMLVTFVSGRGWNRGTTMMIPVGQG